MTRFRFLHRVLAVASVIVALPATADDWLRFRGPNGSGVSASVGVPVEFGPDKNMLWSTEVPFGRSSPVIAAGRLFLTAVDNGKLVTLGLDAASGEILWRREIGRAHSAKLHADTDSATPTPVSDGSNVYVFFHEAGLVSYDASGKERWKRTLGPFRNFYGCASSPVLARNLLLVICDQAEDSFLLAVDAATGTEHWRRNRPARLESYATPILYPDAKNPELVLISASRWVDAYDLASGKNVWTVPGVGTSPVSSPVLVGDTLYVSAKDHAEKGWPDFAGLLKEHDADGDGELGRGDVAEAWLSRHFGWLDTDASGSISSKDWQNLGDEMVNDKWGVHAIKVPRDANGNPNVQWHYQQNVPYIPSPVVYDDVFYMVKDSIVTSLDARTGKLLKRGRLDEGAKVYASPVAADGKIYISTLGGQVAVVKAGADWALLASNEIGEEIHASPAILDGRIYVRTKSRVYSFGVMEEATESDPGS